VAASLSNGGIDGGEETPARHDEVVRFEDKIAWIAYFNAGIRVLDLSDPYNMKELGYYIPKDEPEFQSSVEEPTDGDSDQRRGYQPRGLAYASDRVGNRSVCSAVHGKEAGGDEDELAG
jgi:hypothetical protein